MHKHTVLLNPAHKKVFLTLLIVWTTSVLSGTLLAYYAVPNLLFSVYPGISFGTSTPGAFAAAFLPFLLSAYAVFISRPNWLLLICFCKGFCFSFLGQALYYSYGSAGWLIRLLVLFCDIFATPALLWYSMRRMCLRNSKWEFPCLLAYVAVISGSDSLFISPILADILHYN